MTNSRIHLIRWKDLKLFLFPLFSGLLFLSARAGELSGVIELELRGFMDSPLYRGQDADSLRLSLAAAPEWYHEFNGGHASVVYVPFLRWDAFDEKRTHADYREFLFTWFDDLWELQLGVGKVFWGVTETRHLVDIINQTDGIEDPDGEDKLGQPMIHLSLMPDWEWGTVELFALPGFRERTFAGESGRLRSGLLVADDPTYESGAEQLRLDVAARWSFSAGAFDVGLSGFYGTSRDPILQPERSEMGLPLRLRPHYVVMDQLGLDVQWTRGATLWKLEAIQRGGMGSRFVASTVGVEHTLYGIFSSNADLGLLLEYHYDGRDEDLVDMFDNDVFAGFRFAFNDVQSTELLAGVSTDIDTQSLFYNVEASRRLGDRYSLSLRARIFSHTHPSDMVAHAIRRDDYVELVLSRYF